MSLCTKMKSIDCNNYPSKCKIDCTSFNKDECTDPYKTLTRELCTATKTCCQQTPFNPDGKIWVECLQKKGETGFWPCIIDDKDQCQAAMSPKPECDPPPGNITLYLIVFVTIAIVLLLLIVYISKHWRQTHKT